MRVGWICCVHQNCGAIAHFQTQQIRPAVDVHSSCSFAVTLDQHSKKISTTRLRTRQNTTCNWHLTNPCLPSRPCRWRGICSSSRCALVSAHLGPNGPSSCCCSAGQPQHSSFPTSCLAPNPMHHCFFHGHFFSYHLHLPSECPNTVQNSSQVR